MLSPFSGLPSPHLYPMSILPRLRPAAVKKTGEYPLFFARKNLSQRCRRCAVEPV